MINPREPSSTVLTSPLWYINIISTINGVYIVNQNLNIVNNEQFLMINMYSYNSYVLYCSIMILF